MRSKKRCSICIACGIETFIYFGSCHCRRALSDKKKKTDACKKKGKTFLFTYKKERERQRKKKIREEQGMRSLRKREPPRAVKVINHHCFLAQYIHTKEAK